MKNLGHEELSKITDDIYELTQLNALIGFMQTTFAEGSSAVSEGDAADALYHIYINQMRILERMKKAIESE